MEESRPNVSERFSNLSNEVKDKEVVSQSLRAEKIAQRTEAIKKIGEYISEKWQSFRKWDKEAGRKLRVGAAIAVGTPGVLGEAARDSAIAGAEAVKESVKKGVEISKQYAIDRKDDVVEKAREVNRWAEDRGDDIEIFVENTKDSIVESVNSGIESVHNKYDQTRESISKNFTEAKVYASYKSNEAKARLISGWKRVQAVPLGIRSNIEQGISLKATERINKLTKERDQFNTNIGVYEKNRSSLLNTSKELIEAYNIKEKVETIN